MATKAKESTVRKDKKVTPSSSNTRLPGNTSTKQVVSGSAAKDKTNPSGKPTPNYLRPTLSSRPEPSAKPQVKKPGNEDAANAQKAQILRRRSFDRPPSFTSDPKRPGSRDRTSIRSSSFSSSRIPSNKPVLERNAKSFRPVKSQPPSPSTRTMTRASSFSKNTERSRSGSGTSVPSNLGTELLVPETDVQQSNEETASIPEPEENVESEAQSVVSEVEPENQKHSDDVNSVELNNADDSTLQNSENDNISESMSQAIEIKETELQEQCDENQHKAEENQMNIEEESNNVVDHLEARVAAEDDRNEQEENINEKADASSTAEMQEEKIAEDEKLVDEQTVLKEIKTSSEEEHKANEEQNVAEEAVEETKAEEGTSSAARSQGGQGKKESPAAYNDVIEETKNKLMEKRKNKVKALVGAFETVIDYETAASK